MSDNTRGEQENGERGPGPGGLFQRVGGGGLGVRVVAERKSSPANCMALFSLFWSRVVFGRTPQRSSSWLAL